jgi:hypothetical protein
MFELPMCRDGFNECDKRLAGVVIARWFEFLPQAAFLDRLEDGVAQKCFGVRRPKTPNKGTEYVR